MKGDNFILDKLDYVKPELEIYLGVWYQSIHFLIMIFGVFILCFSNNLQHLMIIFTVLCTDALANCILMTCPLSLYEEKYLGYGYSVSQMNRRGLTNLGVGFDNKNTFESQLESIVNIITITTLKMFFIILWKTSIVF